MQSIPTIFELRLKAAKSGEAKFVALDKCRHGHEPIRYTASGACVQCALEKANATYIAKKKAIQRARA